MGLAVLLLVEGLGIERAGQSCNAGENRQGNQGGYDRLHGYFSKKLLGPTLGLPARMAPSIGGKPPIDARHVLASVSPCLPGAGS